MLFITLFALGLLLGIGLGWGLASRRNAAAETQTDAVLALLQAEEQKAAEREAQMLQRLESSFATLSLNTMERTTDQLAKLTAERVDGQQKRGSEELDGKKQLIDAQLKLVNDGLERMKGALGELEKSRSVQFEQLATQLKLAGDRTDALGRQTQTLNEILGSSQARGQWGERMAEDILRAAGFVEGVNFRKQDSQGENRPDFTFLLPHDYVVNMDVKFPFANYLKVIQCTSTNEKERLIKLFLQDVRSRLKEVSGKAYIDPEHGTVDYVLLFIPNEQIYGFMHAENPDLLDQALKKKIILCSPSTLFVVLAVMRQAMDSFKLQARSNEILLRLNAVRDEWQRYSEAIDRLAKQFRTFGGTLDQVTGARRKKLALQFSRIDDAALAEEPVVRLLEGGASDDP